MGSPEQVLLRTSSGGLFLPTYFHVLCVWGGDSWPWNSTEEIQFGIPAAENVLPLSKKDGFASPGHQQELPGISLGPVAIGSRGNAPEPPQLKCGRGEAAMAELIPTQINWQVPSNSQAHHTNFFAGTELCARRGQKVDFNLYFNRAPQAGERLAFVAEMGPGPSEAQHTRCAFALSNELVGGTWCAVQTSGNGNCINFSICSSCQAAIGRYKLSLQVTCGNQVATRFLGKFVLLFNPWCTGDLVFMANEAERQEYVLNENGIIFVGNANYIEARGWYYGQFQENILNICLHLLHLSLYHRQDPAGDASRRSDPRYVGRVVSSMVNGNDDNGVLEGKWSEGFAHHENPSRWDGSVSILRKWAQGNYRPVQYGQCWVFAGVTGTILRCLGIPTRLVTNFNSAHDSNSNLSIDKYYDPAGKSLKMGQDSVWDYHVWNESWFVRRDLGNAYCGWQVIDATPQERSQGIYQCGPTSVMAVKQGDVKLNYDTAFVYTEVNADINRWVVHSNGKRVRAYCDTSSIGRALSTKAVGSNQRVDVTNNYKFPEGSSEERSIYRKACMLLSGSSPSEAAASELIAHPELFGKFKLTQPPVLGKDVNLILSLSNLSDSPKTVAINLSVSSVLYTRRAVKEILKEATSLHLGGKEEKYLPLRITYGHYGNSLTDDKKLLVTALCDVPGGVKLLVEKAITLESPNLSIVVPPKVFANTPATVEISYANPLPEPVKDCVLLVTLMGQAIKINVADLAAGERSKIYFEFTPRRTGAMQLHVDFSCSKFHHVKSFGSASRPGSVWSVSGPSVSYAFPSASASWPLAQVLLEEALQGPCGFSTPGLVGLATQTGGISGSHHCSGPLLPVCHNFASAADVPNCFQTRMQTVKDSCLFLCTEAPNVKSLWLLVIVLLPEELIETPKGVRHRQGAGQGRPWLLSLLPLPTGKGGEKEGLPAASKAPTDLAHLPGRFQAEPTQNLLEPLPSASWAPSEGGCGCCTIPTTCGAASRSSSSSFPSTANGSPKSQPWVSPCPPSQADFSASLPAKSCPTAYAGQLGLRWQPKSSVPVSSAPKCLELSEAPFSVCWMAALATLAGKRPSQAVQSIRGGQGKPPAAVKRQNNRRKGRAKRKISFGIPVQSWSLDRDTYARTSWLAGRPGRDSHCGTTARSLAARARGAYEWLVLDGEGALKQQLRLSRGSNPPIAMPQEQHPTLSTSPAQRGSFPSCQPAAGLHWEEANGASTPPHCSCIEEAFWANVWLATSGKALCLLQPRALGSPVPGELWCHPSKTSSQPFLGTRSPLAQGGSPHPSSLSPRATFRLSWGPGWLPGCFQRPGCILPVNQPRILGLRRNSPKGASFARRCLAAWVGGGEGESRPQGKAGRPRQKPRSPSSRLPVRRAGREPRGSG
ncbi:protein-glutamine gamma-glutamyltransferase E-like [Crotalus adamanteus]|uniref:protein-glutamine gamma-glutamyltransferase n=1 Tax=Crotalus adamanteus TaxID=8729 RepID=A0AAW1BSY9_CROAD